MLGRFTLAVAAAALVAAPVTAQEAGQFKVGPRLGYIKYAEKSGLQPGGMLGLDAFYRVNNHVGLGFMLGVSRPQTDGQYFPAELTFYDSTFVYQVVQPVTIATYQAAIEFSGGGQFSPFISGAVGGYRVNLDPQVATGNRNFNHLGFTFGGGFQIAAGESARLRLEAYDMVFTHFNRQDLNTTRSLNQPTRFPDLVPPQPPFSGATHNLMASIGFYFTPGGN